MTEHYKIKQRWFWPSRCKYTNTRHLEDLTLPKEGLEKLLGKHASECTHIFTKPGYQEPRELTFTYVGPENPAMPGSHFVHYIVEITPFTPEEIEV